MKQRFLQGIGVALLCLTLAGCAAPAAGEGGALAAGAGSESSAEGSSMVSAVLPTQSGSLQQSTSSTAGALTLSEEEAIAVSLQLYAQGYMMVRGLDCGAMADGSTLLTVDGKQFTGVKQFKTKAELEAALRESFTDACTARLMQHFFDSSREMNYFMEKDGVLYQADLGGIGGTYALWEKDVLLEDFTADGWRFRLFGYDFRADKAEESLQWWFTVKQENGAWRLDAMEGLLDDGSGHIVY